MVRHLTFVWLVGVAATSSAGPLDKGAPKGAPAAAPSGITKAVLRIAPPLTCTRITTADGLPTSRVEAIAQDARGFIWFGTDEGLARYDGIKPRIYRSKPDDLTTPTSGAVSALALDDTGKLWIGTADNGINRYDPDTDRFTRFVKTSDKTGLSSEGVSAITRDAKGRMWFAMSGGGLNVFEPATGTFAAYVKPPLDIGISSMGTDATGNLWLGTANGDVVRWNPNDGSTATFRPPLDNEDTPVSTIMVASTGKIWIGTDGAGAFMLDPASSKFVHYRHDQEEPGTISDDHVSVLFEDRHHNLWIGTHKGLNQLDASGRFLRYEHDPTDPMSLSSPWVLSIHEDRGGVMWIGGEAGVCTFTETSQKFGRQFTGGNATAFFEDPDGTLWIGVYQRGLYKYDRKAQRITVYSDLGTGGRTLPLDKDTIRALYRDRHGTLWIAIRGQGLIGFDTRTETYREYRPDPDDPASMPVDTANDIWEGDQGRLWLATWGAGLVRFDPRNESFTTFGDANGITSNHIYKLYPDPTDKKVLWLGTAQGGLVRFDTAAETATSFRKAANNPTALNNDDVMTIYREPNGIVWVGTFGGGINRLDPAAGKATQLTTANSELTNNTVLGILPDDDGKLWLVTNGGGMLQLDPKTNKFLAYSTSDGLQDNEFTMGAFLRGKSGELFFGALNGFNAFSPHEISRDTFIPPLVLTGFKVNNEEVKLEQPIWKNPPVEVSYTDSFEVQFAALSYAAPKRNRYAYMLQGFDDRFTETDRPYAAYAKLQGGKYVLRIRAANPEGVWNETAVALNLSVRPPFWRTWAAYAVYLLVLIAVASLLIRSQRMKVRRIERESRLAIVEQDLALTGAVQSGFLPENNEVSTAEVDIVGFYRPADACGGDWWWHEPLHAGRHVVLVGDVTGHGPGPAMVTAAVATAFRVLVGAGLEDMRTGLEMLNREVLRVAKGKYHMTMAALVLDSNDGRWLLYSAGAPPILSLDSAGKHKVYFCPGAPLGTEHGYEVGQVEGVLAPNERLLVFTDGIPETTHRNGKVFGMRKFAQVYEHTRQQDLRDAAATMVAHADEIRGRQSQADDWTFAMIEWIGPANRGMIHRRS